MSAVSVPGLRFVDSQNASAVVAVVPDWPGWPRLARVCDGLTVGSADSRGVLN